MKYIHSYRLEEGNSLNDLELLTQLLSVLKLKVSTKSNIELYVDKYTLSEFQKFGMETLYDNINTEVLESFPSKKISKDFWSSAKLWVMKHQEEPFCILDTDLVLHNMTDDVLERSKVSFLHTETPTTYPFPTILNKPKSFKWTEREITSFINSLPVNSSVVAFTDLDFVKEYTDRYFKFVINNKGGYSFKSLDKTQYLHQYGQQITAEQWLLAAMIWDKKHDEYGNHIEGFPTQCLTSAISFPLGFNHQVYNIPNKTIQEQLSSQIFHLWGAKDFYDRAKTENNLELFKEWNKLKEDLISANNDFIEYLKKQEYFDILEKIEEYCREIPKELN